MYGQKTIMREDDFLKLGYEDQKDDPIEDSFESLKVPVNKLEAMLLNLTKDSKINYKLDGDPSKIVTVYPNESLTAIIFPGYVSTYEVPIDVLKRSLESNHEQIVFKKWC